VEHRVDAAELAAREPPVELAPIEVVAETGTEQVAVLRTVGQVVDGDHVVDADRVQSLHEVAADHAGRSGDDDSHLDACMMGKVQVSGCVREGYGRPGAARRLFSQAHAASSS
jgi:hypothetical protein